MLELLFLLLPVAAASGWLIAKKSAARKPHGGVEPDPAYFQGLNYLLNEQPDKAIDAFCRLVEVNAETVETHLALGNLFRRRGEVDRAIRIHQNLVARTHLSSEQRAYALLELGQDYLRAGLFDRAENLFRELVELDLHKRRALMNLKEVFQQERDWEQCLQVAQELSDLAGEEMGPEIAHYHCELSEEARRKGDLASSSEHLRLAQKADPHCVRASILQAQAEMERGDLVAAVKSYRRAERQGPEYLSEILPPLLQGYQRLGARDDMVNDLMKLYRRRQDTAVMQAVADLIREDQGDEAAAVFVAEHLRHHPDLEGLERLLALSGGVPLDELRLRGFLDLSARVARQLLQGQPAYRCDHCGFEARRSHWQCPSCKGWGTVKRPQADP